MDIKKIEQLITLIESSNVNEIEIKEGETSIRITGIQTAPQAAPQAVYHAAPQAPASIAPQSVVEIPKLKQNLTFLKVSKLSHRWLAHSIKHLPLALLPLFKKGKQLKKGIHFA